MAKPSQIIRTGERISTNYIRGVSSKNQKGLEE
jgi:hypothetical protein